MRKIFIVEDNDIMREMLGELIEREPDIELCGEAATAREALELIPSSAPDLVLVDVSLPGMNGIDLVKSVREKRRDILMLVLSGHDESVYAEQALRAGANGYVMKGDPYTVMSSIESVLQGNLCFSQRIKATLQI